MITPEAFVSYLTLKGFRCYSGVPCSYFKDVIACIEDQKDLSYVIAPNEGSALALASGSFLGKKPAVLLIQNSGIGNLTNPLTSLNAIYRIPVPIFVSGRAFGIPDEPQHEIMGKSMTDLFRALGVPYWELPSEDPQFRGVLDRGLAQMRERKSPVFFLVRKGTFGSYAVARAFKPKYTMKRIEAIALIRECIQGEDLVFATTGKPSREFFAIGDRPGNFYMQGSMGHIGALALGTALAHPDRRVLVLDGDGALLMHMGILSSIGHYRPKNLFHLVLDNESYETTGDQDTTAASTDFEAIARACGYLGSAHVQDAPALKRLLPHFLSQAGPVLLRIKISREFTKDIPRITTKYSAAEITESFQRFIVEHEAPRT